MATGGQSNNEDFYKVLGLEKECTPIELKTAYKKLAKKWHPDRCSASGNSKFVEEAKTKFQAIQHAYSVLSDDTKRFLYDVGVYDNDDDDNNHGMGDFLNEMVTMMSEHKPSENGEESFEQLQGLFEEMFQRESYDSFSSTSQGMNPSCSSSYVAPLEGSCTNSKRNSTQMKKSEGSSSFNATYQSFSLGMECRGDSTKAKGLTVRTTQASDGSGGNNGARISSRRYGRKQKVGSGHDVSSKCSNGYQGIST